MKKTLRTTLNKLGLKDVAARLLDGKQKTVDVTPATMRNGERSRCAEHTHRDPRRTRWCYSIASS